MRVQHPRLEGDWAGVNEGVTGVGVGVSGGVVGVRATEERQVYRLVGVSGVVGVVGVIGGTRGG